MKKKMVFTARLVAIVFVLMIITPGYTYKHDMLRVEELNITPKEQVEYSNRKNRRGK